MDPLEQEISRVNIWTPATLWTVVACALIFVATIVFLARWLAKKVLPDIVEYLVFALLGSNEPQDTSANPPPSFSLMHNLPRLIIGLLLGLAMTYVALNFKKWEIGIAFAAFILTAAACGIYLIVILLPMLGEFLGKATLGSNDKVEPTEASPALSKMAQGDYEGAVEAYLKLAEEGEEGYPYGEAAKVCVDRLEDPDRAIEILSTALHNRQWDTENWAYLQFRLADVYLNEKQDFPAAKACMDDVVEHLPNTRHSANANNKLKEIQVAAEVALLTGPPPPADEDQPGTAS